MTAADLYHQALLDTAKSTARAAPLPDADARATADNPLCGDRVTLEARRDDGRLAALAHKVRGCVLCKASAVLLAEAAAGADPAALEAGRTAVTTMLQGGTAPAGRWAPWAVFEPVRTTPSRHDCVLLPFRAALELFEAAPPEPAPRY